MKQTEALNAELDQLKDYFQIPGISYTVLKGDQLLLSEQSGYANLETHESVNENTLFPIASLTKIYTTILLFSLEEEGKIDLNDPITNYIDADIPEEITIAHVLSHTSQGEPGTTFYYSFRFSWLTKVIERSSGMSFKQYLTQTIVTPLALTNTYLLDEEFRNSEAFNRMAKPYNLDGEIVDGNLEMGYSASAGIVTSMKDFIRFNKAFDSNELITQGSKHKMGTPHVLGSPYGLGIFTSAFENTRIVWGYGQYDSYSSLYLKVPDKDLTFIIFANNNLMSDPARLIMGEPTSSLFALSFLKNFVFNQSELPLLETRERLDTLPNAENNLLREKLLAQALAESFLSRFETDRRFMSADLLRKTFELFPDYSYYATINTLHSMSFLNDVAFFMDLEKNNEFDPMIEEIGSLILEKEPYNPYVHNTLAIHYDRKGEVEKTRYHSEKIINTPNFSTHWYTREAQQWLEGNN
ncbi:MAG: hypothetical protein BalsKO_18660 [Balneolaceae bacterium]